MVGVNNRNRGEMGYAYHFGLFCMILEYVWGINITSVLKVVADGDRFVFLLPFCLPAWWM